MFNGTYHSDDVTFLLKVIDIEETDIDEKEKQIPEMAADSCSGGSDSRNDSLRQ